MQTTTTNPVELKIENDNNKFACDIFTHIGFGPLDRIFNNGDINAGFMEEIFEKVYCIKLLNDTFLYTNLINVVPFKFWQIGNTVTIPATGMYAHKWQQEFLKKYPATTDETDMAVYMYARIKDYS